MNREIEKLNSMAIANRNTVYFLASYFTGAKINMDDIHDRRHESSKLNKMEENKTLYNVITVVELKSLFKK